MTHDKKIYDLVRQETARQRDKIGLIASENIVSPDVSKVLSSVLSNKYSEGYPCARYYEGSEFIDKIEITAIERVKELFGVPHVNVQPYSGSPANSAVEFATMNPGDTVMGLKLSAGGHLTHGHPNVTFSGRFFNSVQYGVDSTAHIDMEEVRELAKKHQPKLLIAGTTAYPFIFDFAGFAKIAEEVGAYFLADISHITGLIVAGEHPSPVPYADVVMSTTHKTFRGPRGAMIMVTEKGLKKDPDLAKKIDKAVFPGLQGGPHNATTAAIAVAAHEALQPSFKKYGRQIRLNAAALAKALQAEGLKLVGNGTDNHLLIVDFSNYAVGMGGMISKALDVAGIYANKNTVPEEQGSPVYPSGMRMGTPLVTTRGMKEKEMQQIAKWIGMVSKYVIESNRLPAEKEARKEHLKKFMVTVEKDKYLRGIAREVKTFSRTFPMFDW